MVKLFSVASSNREQFNHNHRPYRETMKEFTSEEKKAIGREAVEILNLRESKEHPEFYITSYGAKSYLGIGRLIVGLVRKHECNSQGD